MAENGKIVYSARCAPCHGKNGEGGLGSPLIGAGADLAKYNDAGNLLDNISSTMPKNSPGSLSRQDNIDVLLYILLQNNYISTEAPFKPDSLSVIKLQ